MAIRVALNHQTLYRYDRMVTLSPQIIRLRPALPDTDPELFLDYSSARAFSQLATGSPE